MKRVKKTTVHKRGRKYEYFYLRRPIKNGKSHRLIRLPGTTVDEIAAALKIAGSEEAAQRRADLEKHILSLLRSARNRSREKSVAFELRPEHLQSLLEKQNYLCAVTGIPLDLWKTGRRRALRRMPFRPSIDRIEPKAGYVPGNVRIVCTAANVALNEWGEDVFRLLAEGFLRTKSNGRLENHLENCPNIDSDAALSV